ncbi:hypothetical protein ACHAO4_000950 [Trichoderma viride]
MRAFTAHASRILAVFLLFSHFRTLNAQNLDILPTPVARLPRRNVEQHGTDFDKRADIQTRMSTCGFQNGDPNKMRTADPGFDCRVDTMNGLWGFCPVTVIAATDCGLAGSCVDQAIFINDEYEADEYGSGFIIVQVNKCISWQHIRAIEALNN